MDKELAIELITEEAKKRLQEHGEFNSYHEGYAVILEEIDELWGEVKKKSRTVYDIQEEAIHAAAMLLRFIVELCG